MDGDDGKGRGRRQECEMTMKLDFSLDLKALKEREFEGYGSVFGNVDLGGDVVVRGAFKRTLAAHKKAGTMPSMFWMHDPSQVAGTWTQMREDEKGLYVKGVLADTQLGNEIRTLLGMKAVRGLSIGFRTLDRDFADDGTRLLKEIELWEVSIVSLAMNPLADVSSVKTRLSISGEYVPEAREFERLLRDAGCSRKVATAITSRVFDTEGSSGMLGDPHQRDSGAVDEDEIASALAKSDELSGRILAGCFRKI